MGWPAYAGDKGRATQQRSAARNRADILRLYHRGHTALYIAKFTGLGYSTVKQHLRAAGYGKQRRRAS